MRPTSDSSKKAGGTFTPTRARTPLNVPISLPKPPTWMSQDAQAHWKELVPVLNKSGVLTAADATMLGALCELAAELAENPRKFTAGKYKELRMLSAEFGCSVSSRLKLKAPEGTTPPEPEKCQSQTQGNVVNISELLSTTRRASSPEKSTPADTSSSPASDS